MANNVTYEELIQKIADLEQQVNTFEQKQVSLKESEKRYRTLLDFAPYPVATFTLKGTVSYLNPAFTDVFGWTLEEMRSGKALFVPPQLAPETSEKLKELFKHRTVTRYVTKRRTKDGRILDVIARGAVFLESEMGLPGELVIFRDITREKRIARSNETMLRISMALPNYPDLEALLDYITGEIKRLLETMGALVILVDDEKKEFFFPGVAYDDRATQKRIKEIRLPIDSLASGQVVKTGKPIIVNDAFKDARRYRKRDLEFGYGFDNYVLVPVRSSERIIGVLAAFNKIHGLFDTPDMDLLEMIAGTVGLSIENARFSDALKKTNKELASLNRAKSKAINHLSHELKTPVAVFSGSLNILEKKLEKLPDETWKRTLDRAQRNIERVKRLQDEINDIMLEKTTPPLNLLNFFVHQCTDILENAIEEESGGEKMVDRVRTRINTIFKAKNNTPEAVFLDEFVKERLAALSSKFSHRHLNIDHDLNSEAFILIPREPLQKVVDGLIKNAVENTPDHGKIKIGVSSQASTVSLVIQDYGIGIIKDYQQRIFEGFFATQETDAYSSKSSFDFNAGGRGADLLRMKIFSQRYCFSISLLSSRCQFILDKKDACAGDIDACPFCNKYTDCYTSGGSTFSVEFKKETVNAAT